MQTAIPWRPPPKQPGPSPDALTDVPAKPPPRPTGRSTGILVILVAAALLLVVVAVVVILALGPVAVITNFQLNDERICTGVPGGDVIATFDHDNAGGPGVVRVYYMDDNATVDIKDYRVGLWSATPVSETLYISGCAPHFIKAEIIAEWAG